VPRYQNNNLLGIGLMLLATFLFAFMDAIAKWLVSADVSAIQVIAVRSWMITLFVPLFCWPAASSGNWVRANHCITWHVE
jgi:drug/metabolite transporter (DMT)-like permease